MEGLIVSEIGNGLFTVKSGSNNYIVDINREQCTCTGYFYNKTCKHIRAVMRYVARKHLNPKVEICGDCRGENG